MLQALIDKITNGMLWWLVIPIALLILSLAFLTGAYTRFIWNAKEVSVESQFGKITAQIDTFQNQIQNATSFLNQQQAQLRSNTGKLEKLLINITTKGSIYSSTNQIKQSSSVLERYEPKTITDLADVVTNLKAQSDALIDQKQKLEIISHGLQQFRQELTQYSDEYKRYHK